MFAKDDIFIDEYPVEAVSFCASSEGKYRIDEIEADEDGHRRFQIVEVPAPTKAELAALKLAQATSMEARMAAMEDALATLLGGAE